MGENATLETLKRFLEKYGQRIDIMPLTPDAGLRGYYRVQWNGKSAIACVYPNDDFSQNQFKASIDVTSVFVEGGLPVAKNLFIDEELCVIVHEDFGDGILRDFLLKSDENVREDYLNQAISLISRIQKATPIAFEQNSICSKLKFDVEKLTWELSFFKTHYFGSLRGKTLDTATLDALDNEFLKLAQILESKAAVLTHRDFHAANLMLDAENNIKIIDFQDARIGTASYDLVSLLLDRVTTAPTPEWLAEKRRFFINECVKVGLPELEESDFADEFRYQTIQRCLKAIGTFSFQIANRGKTNYEQYINPMFEIVLRAANNLDEYPVLSEVLSFEITSKY